MPHFAHVSLILAPDRSKLSKRHGATSVGQVNDRHIVACFPFETVLGVYVSGKHLIFFGLDVSIYPFLLSWWIEKSQCFPFVDSSGTWAICLGQWWTICLSWDGVMVQKMSFSPLSNLVLYCLYADVHMTNASSVACTHFYIFAFPMIASHFFCSWKVHNWTCKQKWGHIWFDQVKVLVYMYVFF